MTTIVMNTLTGAVTEYDWAFQSITPEHAGSADGLFTLGGDTDDGAEIEAELRGSKAGGTAKQGLGNVYLAVQGEGAGRLIVAGQSSEWEYPVTVRASGVSRARPGHGISENYLTLGYRNVAGAAFRLDRIDAEVYESNHGRL
jgi:hypothetical protein